MKLPIPNATCRQPLSNRATRSRPRRKSRCRDNPATRRPVRKPTAPVDPQTVSFEPFDISTYPGFLRLAPGQQDFLVAWARNGRNATRAYMAAHPTVSQKVARVEGCRDLAKPSIKSLADAYTLTSLQSEHLGRDEALALLARRARGNIAHIFGPSGQMLQPDEWPKETASAVKSFKVSSTGVSVTMHDPQRPIEQVLELLGAVKSTGGGLAELAAALREDLARHDTQPHLGIPMSG